MRSSSVKPVRVERKDDERRRQSTHTDTHTLKQREELQRQALIPTDLV